MTQAVDNEVLIRDLQNETRKLYLKFGSTLRNTINAQNLGGTSIMDGRDDLIAAPVRGGIIPVRSETTELFYSVAQSLATNLGDIANRQILTALYETPQILHAEPGYTFTSGIETLSKTPNRTDAQDRVEWYGLLGWVQWQELSHSSEFGELPYATSAEGCPAGMQGKKWHNTLWMPYEGLGPDILKEFFKGIHYHASSIDHDLCGDVSITVEKDGPRLLSFTPKIFQHALLMDEACTTLINYKT